MLSSEIQINHPDVLCYNSHIPGFSEIVLFSSLCPVIFIQYQVFQKCHHVVDCFKVSNIDRALTHCKLESLSLESRGLGRPGDKELQKNLVRLRLWGIPSLWKNQGGWPNAGWRVGSLSRKSSI